MDKDKLFEDVINTIDFENPDSKTNELNYWGIDDKNPLQEEIISLYNNPSVKIWKKNKFLNYETTISNIAKKLIEKYDN